MKISTPRCLWWAPLLMFLAACGQSPDPVAATPPDVAPTPSEAVSAPAAAPLIDANATAATAALYRNLHALKGQSILFGHQDTMAYGVEWQGEKSDSDIKRLTGSFPAIYGWDIGALELGQAHNLDGVDFASMRQWMIGAHKRGGINTISWHMYNPLTGGGSWDTQPTVGQLLPGAEHHELLVSYLDSFVAFNEGLRDASGEPIPVIFRPWHEHNGDWFWWGRGHSSAEEYRALWRFTVEHLRDTRGQHNLIYAYSPDRSRIDLDNFTEGYLWGYPGDDYVDILGIDNYWDLGHPANTASDESQRAGLERSLTYTARLAREKNKIAAFTEGGLEAIPEERFWTDRLLPALLADEHQREIVYVMVWRNANREKEEREHYYAPYPGQKSAGNFVEFTGHEAILLEDDLPAMYR